MGSDGLIPIHGKPVRNEEGEAEQSPLIQTVIRGHRPPRPLPQNQSRYSLLRRPVQEIQRPRNFLERIQRSCFFETSVASTCASKRSAYLASVCSSSTHRRR